MSSRSLNEIRNFDLFKFVVLVCLLLSLLAFQPISKSSSTPGPVATESKAPPATSNVTMLKITSHRSGDSINASSKIAFAGVAKPGTKVVLYVDQWMVGEAMADAHGSWSASGAIEYSDSTRNIIARDPETGESAQVTVKVANGRNIHE